jgi:hypothetical protein
MDHKPDVNFQVLSFMGEYAPKGNDRFSAFIQIPFRWLQPEGVTLGLSQRRRN